MLTKFLSNQCSYTECESIARILQSDAGELDQINLFEHLPEEVLIRVSEGEKNQVLQAILPKKVSRTLMKVLLAASLVFALIFSWLQLGKQMDFQDLPGSRWVELENNQSTGSSKWYLLPDSSRIRLEPNARVRYARDFAGNRQLVQLAGQITYYVHPHQAHSFSVLNQGIVTTALGTIFTIGDYDEANLRIELVEGKIEIKRAAEGIGQRITLDEQSTLVVNTADFKHRILSDEKPSYTEVWQEQQHTSTQAVAVGAIAWSNRVVSFSGVSNADLFGIMERLFSVTIDVENPEITNGNFTGELYQNDHIEDLLHIFCEINGCTFISSDKVIKIM